MTSQQGQRVEGAQSVKERKSFMNLGSVTTLNRPILARLDKIRSHFQ